MRALAADRALRGHPATALIAMVLCGAVAAGALVLADVRGDSSAQRVAVQARLSSGGRSPTPRLRLATGDVRARDAAWQTARVGGEVCVVQGDGLFGWRWLEIDTAAACPP